MKRNTPSAKRRIPSIYGSEPQESNFVQDYNGEEHIVSTPRLPSQFSSGGGPRCGPCPSDTNKNRSNTGGGGGRVGDTPVCLHCEKPSDTWQVKCDECQSSFICNDCHWCHEYQGNHEIRVCDRCDAYYCYHCDEMDQCEDCGEVVCSSCSTLLSCKFCGGGLCEECATACGRCGIVLCSRDAKFAVECDTCRLPYCLVCLASGSKDPCVRCGHRPSKRMEQLVHLRLKSIYKAFKKQSSSSTTTTTTTNTSTTTTTQSTPTTSNPSILTNDNDTTPNNNKRNNSSSNKNNNNTSSSSSNNNSQYFNDPFSNPYYGNSPQLYHPLNGYGYFDDGPPMMDDLGDGIGDYLPYHLDPNDYFHPSQHFNNGTNTRISNPRLQGGPHPPKGRQQQQHNPPPEERRNYHSGSTTNHHPCLSGRLLEEKQREADAAAEALLAELQQEEEEEAAAKAKQQSKKKKKRTRNQPPPTPPPPSSSSSSSAPQHEHAQQQQPELPQPQQQESHESQEVTIATKAISEEDKGTTVVPQPSIEPISIEDKSTTKPQPTTKKNKGKKNVPSAHLPIDEPLSENLIPLEPTEVAVSETNNAPSELKAAEAIEVDPLELELFRCVENDDAIGIEDILFQLKGVPGRAALRKNAKKALKRLRPPTDPVEVADLPEDVPTIFVDPPTTTMNEPVELLRMVSDKMMAGKLPSTSRVECIMQISPLVVGWLIGKGGQRIRDLMEESGARMWIDQEKAQVEDHRNVYISGDRHAVDQAVYMVRDIVSKAPVDGAAKYAPGRTKKSVSTVENPQEAVARSSPAHTFTISDWCDRSAGLTSQFFQTASEGDIPLIPTEPWSLLNSKDNLQKFEHVMTCEARFVPLLIGKRGWAIKDIQDKSGAKIDIDQTRTPREIRISGSKESVDKAIPMVRDVLSYPHAQPQNYGFIPDEVDQLLGMDAIWDGDQNEDFPSDAMGGERLPPPYSYITTGDAKSAISASSSLSSSTREPSVVAPLKMQHSQFPPASPIPPSAACLLPQSSHDVSHMSRGGPHLLRQDLSSRVISRSGGHDLCSSGVGLMGIQSPLPLHHAVPHMQNHVTPSSSRMLSSHNESFGIGGPSMIPPQQQQIGEYHSLPGLAQLGSNILSPRPDGGGFDRTSGNQLSSWNPAEPITGSSLPARSFQPLAATNLIPAGFEHSSSLYTTLPAMAPPSDIPTGGPLGSSYGMGHTAGVSGVPSTSFATGIAGGSSMQGDSLRDDSRLIESLFGKDSKVHSTDGLSQIGTNSADSLVPGLNSLHLSNTTTASSSYGDALWGDGATWIASTMWDSTSNSKDISENPVVSGLSSLDSALVNNQQHPHRSRFHWCSTNV